MELIPFVHTFYYFKFFFKNNHCNYEGDVVTISFAMGTCQGDP
jgi:hypothetical protein